MSDKLSGCLLQWGPSDKWNNTLIIVYFFGFNSDIFDFNSDYSFVNVYLISHFQLVTLL
mgnify:CR=1 FL=1